MTRPETDRCEAFLYRGCGGNANRFVGRAECEDFCGMVRSEERAGGEGDCNLPADPGNCQANTTSWHYSPSSEQCQPFTWGGCGVGTHHNAVHRFESFRKTDSS